MAHSSDNPAPRRPDHPAILEYAGEATPARKLRINWLVPLFAAPVICLGLAFIVQNFVSSSSADGVEKRAIACGVGPFVTLSTQIKLFRMHMGRWPDELAELCVAPTLPEERERWQGPYVNDCKHLRDPWGSELGYEKLTGDTYRVWSAGPDRTHGTQDDVTPDKPYIHTQAWHAKDWIAPLCLAFVVTLLLGVIRHNRTTEESA